MKLEERITDGIATYVDKIERDLENGRLVFYLLQNPEVSLRVSRILTFVKVRDFSEVWDNKWDDDEDTLEDLLGITEFPQDALVEYHVRLDQSAMTFYSDAVPVLQDV